MAVRVNICTCFKALSETRELSIRPTNKRGTRRREYRCSFDELIFALRWGANDLSQRGLGFRADQVISAGGPHIPVEATEGTEFVVRYGDAGEIKARFE